MADVRTSESKGVDCELITGTYSRWVGEGKGNFGRKKAYVRHRANDSTRVVKNVSQDEYESRKYQLRPVGGGFSIESRFSPEDIRGNSIRVAKNLIQLATDRDVRELEILAQRDSQERKSLKPIYQATLRKLGSNLILE